MSDLLHIFICLGILFPAIPGFKHDSVESNDGILLRSLLQSKSQSKREDLIKIGNRIQEIVNQWESVVEATTEATDFVKESKEKNKRSFWSSGRTANQIADADGKFFTHGNTLADFNILADSAHNWQMSLLNVALAKAILRQLMLTSSQQRSWSGFSKSLKQIRDEEEAALSLIDIELTKSSQNVESMTSFVRDVAKCLKMTRNDDRNTCLKSVLPALEHTYAALDYSSTQMAAVVRRVLDETNKVLATLPSSAILKPVTNEQNRLAQLVHQMAMESTKQSYQQEGKSVYELFSDTFMMPVPTRVTLRLDQAKRAKVVVDMKIQLFNKLLNEIAKFRDQSATKAVENHTKCSQVFLRLTELDLYRVSQDETVNAFRSGLQCYRELMTQWAREMRLFFKQPTDLVRALSSMGHSLQLNPKLESEWFKSKILNGQPAISLIESVARDYKDIVRKTLTVEEGEALWQSYLTCSNRMLDGLSQKEGAMVRRVKSRRFELEKLRKYVNN